MNSSKSNVQHRLLLLVCWVSAIFSAFFLEAREHMIYCACLMRNFAKIEWTKERERTSETRINTNGTQRKREFHLCIMGAKERTKMMTVHGIKWKCWFTFFIPLFTVLHSLNACNNKVPETKPNQTIPISAGARSANQAEHSINIFFCILLTKTRSYSRAQWIHFATPTLFNKLRLIFKKKFCIQYRTKNSADGKRIPVQSNTVHIYCCYRVRCYWRIFWHSITRDAKTSTMYNDRGASALSAVRWVCCQSKIIRIPSFGIISN